jgi:cardiolipin synthase
MPALMAIAQAGGRVLGFEHLHGKAVCADSQAALVMTANLQADGLDRGFEVGLLMQDGRALDVHRVLNTWAEQANWELRMQPSIGDVVGLAKVWRGQKLEDMEIKEVETVDLGTVVAASAEDLAAAVPVWPQASGVTKPARQLRCKWRVEAPVLAPKADEVRRPPAEKGGKAMPYRPPVYREGKRKVVAVRTAADIEGAKKVREEVGAEAIVLQSRSLLS